MKAKAFNGTIMLATVIGAVLNFTPINPIKALVWTAVINGIVAVPVMGIMMYFAHAGMWSGSSSSPGCSNRLDG
jgi:Mn2+/Fe2+ NRAMP family transporter